MYKRQDKGLESLSIHIPDEEFQRHIQLKPMTDEHRQLLLSSEEQLVNKVVVSDDLLDKLSLSRRCRQAIKTHEQQVKTLLDIVSRRPDCAFTQLLNALKDTNQHEAADIISSNSRTATESEVSGLRGETHTEDVWNQVDQELKSLRYCILS